jgi:two-component system OmpR family response regulator
MRILLIEDDADVAQVVVNAMSEAGHSVVHADNGRDGIALAESQRFDAMIFDRQLPDGIDGANLLEILRGKAIATPVMFLSGLGGLQDWMKGLEAGGDDYLVKPFEVAELRNRIEVLHARAQSEKGQAA